jgi:hypothetical protein
MRRRAFSSRRLIRYFSSTQISMKNQRSAFRFSKILILVGVFGFAIWNIPGSSPDKQRAAVHPSDPQVSAGRGSTQTAGDDTDAAGNPKTSSGRRGTSTHSSSEEGEESPQFPHVNVVLEDDTLSVEDTAKRLLGIATDSSLSVLEREEALAHGLLLDFPRFADFAMDPHLPQPLALRFFDEMLNENDHRDIQVRACIALVDHDDEAIRQEAAEQLAFYIGLEEHAENPELLKREAYTYLEELARLPPQPESKEDEGEGDIPETAPTATLPADEGVTVDLEEDEP